MTTIGLFGGQYAVSAERASQRGSLEYWLGRFEQAGGDVILPVKANTLLAYPATLYGYESHDACGKLTGDYQPVKGPGSALGVVRERPEPLVLQAPDDATRPDLAPPPPGETIAWDRRAALCGLAG